MSNELTKKEIKDIINDEVDKAFNKLFVDSFVKELKKSSSPAKKELVDMMKNAMVAVHKFMWLRRDVWQSDIK